MIEKLGFEKDRHVSRSYGRAGLITIDGVSYYCASQAEAKFIEEVHLCLRSRDIRRFFWQPDPVVLDYQYAKNRAVQLYRPDARILWVNGDDHTYEIKHGRIEQAAGNKMLRFCEQYPDRPLVLVWKGREPKKGTTKRQWDKLMPHLHHVWYLK